MKHATFGANELKRLNAAIFDGKRNMLEIVKPPNAGRGRRSATSRRIVQHK